MSTNYQTAEVDTVTGYRPNALFYNDEGNYVAKLLMYAFTEPDELNRALGDMRREGKKPDIVKALTSNGYLGVVDSIHGIYVGAGMVVVGDYQSKEVPKPYIVVPWGGHTDDGRELTITLYGVVLYKQDGEWRLAYPIAREESRAIEGFDITEPDIATTRVTGDVDDFVRKWRRLDPRDIHQMTTYILKKMKRGTVNEVDISELVPPYLMDRFGYENLQETEV